MGAYASSEYLTLNQLHVHVHVYLCHLQNFLTNPLNLEPYMMQCSCLKKCVRSHTCKDWGVTHTHTDTPSYLHVINNATNIEKITVRYTNVHVHWC